MAANENNQTDRAAEQAGPTNAAERRTNNSAATDPAVAEFVARLTQEERMLVVLQHELYDQSWSAMLTDLSNRLEGKPYIFKLANRIRDDIARIEKLQAFEQQHKVKLSDYIDLPEPPSRPDEP